MMQKMTAAPITQKQKRNLYISYIKGVAIIGIMLIHTINWSNINLPRWGEVFEDWLHAAVFLFVLTTGSVLYVAYQHRTVAQQWKRLLHRAGTLLFIYYLYSIIKLLIFNFSTEPFYLQFINKGTFTVSDILAFHSFSVPITVLITYAFLLALAPLILLISKRSRYAAWVLSLLTVGIFVLNYLTPLSVINNPIIQFVYAKGYIAFPVMLWIVPLLMGFILAQIGFERQRLWLLIGGGVSTLVTMGVLLHYHESLELSAYEFPLEPYFIFAGVLCLALFIYVFRFLERVRNKWMKWFLAVIRLLGDNTLHIYVLHWVVIDLTIWLVAPTVTWIWVMVPLFVIGYLIWSRKKLFSYYRYQREAARDLGAELI